MKRKYDKGRENTQPPKDAIEIDNLRPKINLIYTV